MVEPKKAVVLIDGENIEKVLSKHLLRQGIDRDPGLLIDFPRLTDWFGRHPVVDRPVKFVRYYNAEPKPIGKPDKKMPKHLAAEIRKFNDAIPVRERHFANLREQGIDVRLCGRVHIKQCEGQHSTKGGGQAQCTRIDRSQKQVDTTILTDMARLAYDDDEVDTIVVVSADTDMIPGHLLVIERGKRAIAAVIKGQTSGEWFHPGSPWRRLLFDTDQLMGFHIPQKREIDDLSAIDL